MANNEPMSDERLAEIRKRVGGENDAGYYWARQAAEDRAALLADNDRLRAALVKKEEKEEKEAQPSATRVDYGPNRMVRVIEGQAVDVHGNPFPILIVEPPEED